MLSVRGIAVAGLLLGSIDTGPSDAAVAYPFAYWYSGACMAGATSPAVFAADFDGDGDLDQKDFGHMQVCFTGPGVIQNDPFCLDARLDEDADVDRDDFTVFASCANGPNVELDLACRSAPVSWRDDPVVAAQPATVPRAYWSDAYYNSESPVGKIVGWDSAGGTNGFPLQCLRGHLATWDGTMRGSILFDPDYYDGDTTHIAVTQFYSTPVGLFIAGRKGSNLVLSRVKSWADPTTTRCLGPEGGDFGVNWKLGQNGTYPLPRNLVYIPPTVAHADGILLFFEYAVYAPTKCRVLYSLDKGANWALLFTASSAIKHFHGAKWVPGTAENGLNAASGGRLYVFTGDGSPDPAGHPELVAAALLFCDDIDDLITNPET